MRTKTASSWELLGNASLTPSQVLVLLVVMSFFSYTERQRRLLPEWEGSDTMEKQRMSLAGTPGIAMCCLFEISAVVPGENQSWQADRNTGCPVVEPPPVPWHLDPQTLGKTMRPIQQQALASPPKRWVSFRAGHWKRFVFGKGLQIPKTRQANILPNP